LLAFETGQNVAYVQTSGWQRAYLLWTFRNFRGVPHKILNQRQTELIESLYASASSDAVRANADTIIGTVEGFFPPDSQRSNISEKPQPATPKKKPETPERLETGSPIFPPRSVFSRLTLQFATAAMLTVLATLSWQKLHNRPVVSASITSATVADQDSFQPRLIAIPTPSVPVQAALVVATAPVPNPQQAADSAGRTSLSLDTTPVQMPTRQISNFVRVNAHGGLTNVTEPPETSVARVQMSGPPQKIVYPDCPNTNARGKVLMQAVVGSDGSVTRVMVLTGNRSLAVAAAKAISEWRYAPLSGGAKRDSGKNVDPRKLERETNISVSFIASDVVAISFPGSSLNLQ
jgi:hypothetical protein